jgi:hypothetical protein
MIELNMAKIVKKRCPPFALLHEGNQKTPGRGNIVHRKTDLAKPNS